MQTLKILVEKINEKLSDLIGETVESPIDVYKKARIEIKNNDFYQELIQNGLEHLLVLKDDSLEELKFIFLKTSETDSKIKKIIEIKMTINSFDDSNVSNGGIINRLECELIGVGEKLKNIPISKVILALQLSDLTEKKDLVDNEIIKYKDALESLEAERKIYEEKIVNLKTEFTKTNTDN